MATQKIIVVNGMGRPVNPHQQPPIPFQHTQWHMFEESVQSHPCPELSDSKGEVVGAVLMKQYWAFEQWNDGEYPHRTKTRQIYKLVPKEEKATPNDMKEELKMPILKYKELVKEHPECPISVPFELLSEEQAQINHSQALQILAQRGGLYPCEMIAVMDKRKWTKMFQSEAIKQINQRIREYQDNPTPSSNKTAEELLREQIGYAGKGNAVVPAIHFDDIVKVIETCITQSAASKDAEIKRLREALEEITEIDWQSDSAIEIIKLMYSIASEALKK